MSIATNSVAVLPLDNLSGDPEQEYFVTGMHEALIADLARISGLKVISRTSTLQYANSGTPAADIGAELGVAHLLHGSVQRVADRVRINVQLIDAAADSNIWTESYERDVVDVLKLQSDIARAVASQVRVQITPFEETSFLASESVDPVAYELYLKGRFHWYRFNEADLKLALEYFQESIERDPTYPLAYVGFADALATPAHMGMMPTTQVFPAASGYIDRALQLDPNLAEAHDLRGRFSFAYDWDWDAADREFRRAISLKPGYPDAHVVYSQFLGVTNRWDESLQEAQIALELDPLNPWYRLELAQRLYWFGQVDEATSMLRQLAAAQPEFYAPWETLADLEYRLGNVDAAIDAAARLYEILGEEEVARVIDQERDELGHKELMTRVAEMLESGSMRPYVSNVDKARAWMLAGVSSRTLDYLERAYDAHESHLVYTIADPLYEPVRGHERYRTILENMNVRD
jgi:TolB-like protein/tetratricopeptide (TPR) repeat protein